MISVLTVATLVYAATLVLVLVLVLTTVAVQLWLISHALRDTRVALDRVREHTADLQTNVAGVAELTEHNVQRLERATFTIEETLQPVIAPSGVLVR